MWNNYKPTKSEKHVIEGAYRHIAECHVSSPYVLDKWMNEERRGYGNRNDSIPKIGAMALCVKWFLYGVRTPDALLRDTFEMRPAAVWLQGLGARRSTGAPAINLICLQNAVEAHEAAFYRMIHNDALEAA